MKADVQSNFAGRLIERLCSRSQLVDAPTREVLQGAEISAVVSSFAAAFSSAGLNVGDRILIACNQRPLSSLAYLGAMHAGLVAVPVNESGLETSGGALSSKARARAVWTESRRRFEWAEHGGLVQIDGRPPQSRRDGHPPAACRKDDLAALMATSGSTGTPRLVKVSHGNLIANTEAIIRSQRLASDERAMLILPISYCFGASVLHSHLYQGGSVVFDSRFMFPDKVLRATAQCACTTFAGVPTAYNILLRRSNLRNIPLPGLRRFLQAGGALSIDSVRQMRTLVPHAEFFVMYGQTEATSRIACVPPDRSEEKLGSVGVPLDNLTVRIVDSDGAEVPAGSSGELYVAGESICAGYFDEPEETERKFRDGWLATGDIAARDQDGFLWITGRRAEFIKMRGVRVGFAEIESRIAAVPGVAECAAVAVPHVEAGEALVLYIVAPRAPADLAKAIRRRMPTAWVCDSIRLISELPRNPYGKLLRHRLHEKGAGDRLSRERERAITHAESDRGVERVSELLANIHRQIDRLLAAATFSLDPDEQQAMLLALLREELAYAAEQNPRFGNYVDAWPIDYRTAGSIADLPYLPAAAFKADPPLMLAHPGSIIRTLASSATTGQTPSRVVLDADTSKRMVKGLTSIIKDFIGPKRRPYLIIDTPETLAAPAELGARGAAIQGLRPFSTEAVFCLKGGSGGKFEIDERALLEFAERWGHGEVLVYGFTYVVWQHFVLPLRAKGIRLEMPHVRLLHSGGWKRLQDQAVTRTTFDSGVAEVFGCDESRVVDFYGMVENVGVIYPDCEYGNKHAPAFAAVIVRDPLTLRPVEPGGLGLVQVCSALPTSFPGHLVLTNDIGEVIRYDGCPCGRRGICFRFVKRVPKVEARGCGNIETVRERPAA